MKIIITPCLLGFDVKIGSLTGHGFIKCLGIFTHAQLINQLIWTEEPFELELR